MLALVPELPIASQRPLAPTGFAVLTTDGEHGGEGSVLTTDGEHGGEGNVHTTDGEHGGEGSVHTTDGEHDRRAAGKAALTSPGGGARQ